MSKNTGGPAFPLNLKEKWFEGMSLRDYFAAKAMQGIMMGRFPITLDPNAENLIAKAAYIQADAMLKAREA